MPFAALNLIPEIVKSLVESGYTKPTPIQETAIPKIIEGCDLLASAQTGSGKTAAFILPSLQKLSNPATVKGQGPRAVILVPTRELAMQVATQAVKYSKYMPKMRTVCIYGGAPYPVQNRQLARPFEILVATPGRLIDHMEQGRIDFSRVELFVLDEADRMLDMGFIHDVKHITESLPTNRQTLLFSATLEGEILSLSKKLLSNPFEINLASNTKKHENIEQLLYYADNLQHKIRLLEHFLKDTSVTQSIIFTSTKIFANELCQMLRELDYQVGVLHGDLDQRRRTSTTRQFREGKLSILVATDVAARGIDIPAISHVFNFDLPANVEDYVHRIGRTGRADAKGIAISLALGRDRLLIARIEKMTGKNMEAKVVEGLEPTIKQDRPRRSGPFSERSRSSGPRSSGQRPERSRSYGQRSEGARSYGQRSEGARSEHSRPYGQRSDSARPYGQNSSQNSEGSKFYGDRSDAPRGEQQRSRGKPFSERSEQARSFGPKKNFGQKNSDSKGSFGPRKSFGSKGPNSRGDFGKSKKRAPSEV